MAVAPLLDEEPAEKAGASGDQGVEDRGGSKPLAPSAEPPLSLREGDRNLTADGAKASAGPSGSGGRPGGGGYGRGYGVTLLPPKVTTREPSVANDQSIAPE